MSLMRDKAKRNAIRTEVYKHLDSSGMDVQSVVKSLRKMLAKDQQEFALMVGIGLSTLRKVEQGKGNVTLLTLKTILDKFSLELVVRRKPPKRP